MACHWGWGGKLTGEQCPGELVGDGQPTDFLPRRAPGLLDRVDLPDLVGDQGADQGDFRALGPSWPVDSGPLEGPLEHPRGRDPVRHELLAQFQADPAGTPARVVVLELAGTVADDLGRAGCRLPTGMVSDGQPIRAAIAEGTPGGADGVKGESKFAGDRSQGLALAMAADDVLACVRGQRARHGRTSLRAIRSGRQIDPTHARVFG